MKNKRPLKVSEEFHNFLEKFGINRIKADVDTKPRNLCDLPDIIMKYFKLNNNRYLELVKLEIENGNR